MENSIHERNFNKPENEIEFQIGKEKVERCYEWDMQIEHIFYEKPDKILPL